MKNETFNMVDFANGVLHQQRNLGITSKSVTINVSFQMKETYEEFTSRGKKYVQYEYVHTNGKIFHMIGYSLDECREHKNSWIKGGFEL